MKYEDEFYHELKDMLPVVDQFLIYTKTDLNGIITYVSSNFEKISGYSKNELIGKPHNIIRDSKMPSSVFEEMWEKIKSGKKWEGIIKNRNKSGGAFILKSAIYPIKNRSEEIVGYAAFHQDITKEMMQKSRNKRILDAQYSVIAILDRTKLIYLNKIFFKNYKFNDFDDFKSKHKCICEFFEQHNKKALMPKMGDLYWLDYIKQNSNDDNLVYMKDKDNQQKIYIPYYGGKISKHEEIVVFIDVTRLKQQAQTLKEQSRFVAMGEMMSMIAHQWRQPLAAMGALMSKMNFKRQLGEFDDHLWDESFLKHHELIQHMSNTIDDFKDFFKASVKPREVSVSNIINSPYRLIEALFTKNNVKFKIEYQDEYLKDKLIFTVKSKLDQVIMNIYKNALDIFIEKKIQNPIINVLCYESNGYINIKICDNAGGISDQFLEKIFDPHFSTKGDNGTGIGLYMSKIIVQSNLKGKLEATNEGEGACFTIKLPF